MTNVDWQFHLEKASENWRQWQDVYEHTEDPHHNPLLVDSTTFGRFLKRYSVGRTIRRGTSDALRELLRSSQFPLKELLEDTSGAMLDEQNDKLRDKFGTHDGRHGLRSALSKIAAFLAPHAFNPWDTDARAGLKREQQGRSQRVRTYVDYLAHLEELLRGELGARIRDVCNGKYPTEYAANRDRFHRRVLDRYLMVLGGRKKRE